MDNVVKFPTKSIRDRANLERQIQAGLNDEGLPRKASEIVISNMSGFIDALCWNFEFAFSTTDPTAINKQIEEFQSLIDCQTNALIRERVMMEVRNLAASGAL